MLSQKTGLRKKIRAARDALSIEAIKNKSASIAENLFALPEFRKAKTVAFYISKGSEVQTKSMLENAIAEGKKILVPSASERFILLEFVSFSDLEKGRFGLLEPKTKIAAKQEPDLIIIPGLAFDKNGNRIGYGKGGYDNFLKNSKAKRIALCFECQLVDKIPAEEHDQKMDIVVTEKRVLRISD